LEAFVDSVQGCIRQFDAWCAEKETALMHAGEGDGSIVSLLGLDKDLRDVWTDPLSALVSIDMTSNVLDALQDAVEDCQEWGEEGTASTLKEILSTTARPLWNMLQRWLKYGDVQEKEFFIEGNTDIVQIWEPDFWKEGFTLRDSVPRFFEELKEDILSAGKGVALLRALKLQDSAFEINLGDPASPDSEASVREYSADVGQLVVKTITDDCGLYIHLQRIEDVFLWRGEDGTMSLFADVLFAKVSLLWYHSFGIMSDSSPGRHRAKLDGLSLSEHSISGYISSRRACAVFLSTHGTPAKQKINTSV
jgi:gamma-tubulin complex component 5